ncbi:MAG: cell wall-binding repeat-containing protein, partial [Erysipelotrichaceae bacterium]|nr:cell wall-binding repeat-containing protein [Erysipelotrichaceae bacterium]
IESEEGYGIQARVREGAEAEIFADYYVDSKERGISLWCYDGSSGVIKAGAITAGLIGFDIGGMSGSTISAEIAGNIETTGENSLGMDLYSKGGSSITVSQNSNISSACDGLVVDADPKSSVQVTVIGDIEGGREGLRVGISEGETTYSGLNADVIVLGTVSGGTIGISKDTSFGTGGTYRIAVWKVIPNAEGHVAMEGDYDTLFGTNETDYSYSEEFEKSINYIIAYTMKAGQRFTPVDKNGNPLELINDNYYVAHEGDYVSLKPQTEGGVITAAYQYTDNGKELLDKDAEGNFYVIVPRGGGIKLTADIEYPGGVTSVSLDKTVLTLTEGESSALKATVLPDNTADKTVAWSTSDSSVASVDDSGKVTALKEGTAVITVTTRDGGKTASCTVTVKKKDTPEPVTSDVIRLSGKTRYDTSLAAAEELKSVLGVKQFNAVILATGENFADALGGGYLAARKNAPILLTNDKNASKINAYINANLKDGGTVYVLGGTGAVSEAALAGLKVTPKRLSGKTRYDTNLEILKEAGVTNEDILICSGTNFADALSASAAGRPMLLVNGQNASLNKAQKAFLAAHASNHLYILGGTGAVSAEIEEEVKTYSRPLRLTGKDRFETSAYIAAEFFGKRDIAILAYSHGYADGLCAGPLGYALKAPVLLTRPGSELWAFTYTTSFSITKGYVTGGDGRIPDDSVRAIFHLPADAVIGKR